MALLFEQRQRERGVVGGQRAPIVELDAGTHQEPVDQAVLRYSNGPRGKPVQSIRLVRSAHHQACESELHALGGVALQNEAVQRIESQTVLIENQVRTDIRERPAFRRIRVDIIELLEVGRIFEVPERRDAMTFRRLLRTRTLRQHGGQRRHAEDQRLAAGHIGVVSHWRAPVLSGFFRRGTATRRPLFRAAL
jgi:hypothetical protein